MGKLKWNHNESGKLYKLAIESQTIRKKVSDFMSKSFNDEKSSINTCCNEINDIIIGAGRLSMKPFKRRQPNGSQVKRKPDKLGFDQECRSLKNRVINLGKLVGKFPKDPYIHGLFISTRKKFRSLVKNKYQDMRVKLLKQISNSQDSNPQEFWKLVNKLKGAKKENSNPIPMDEWETYFKSLHQTSLVTNPNEAFTKYVNDMLKFNTGIKSDLLDAPIDSGELLRSVKKLKKGKASGPDDIMNEMIKSGGKPLHECLLKLFNMILKYECVPSQWTFGYIVPLHKGGSKTVTTNYRGISITSSLGKLFSAVLNERLYEVMKSQKMIAPSQIGFMKGKRTSDHIFVLKCIIEEAKSKRRPIFACFVDLRKAYDTIWREGLYFKLLFDYQISEKFVTIIKSLYTNIRGIVKVDCKTSSPFDILIGLRQGCNLSPYLFNLYINDLSKVLDLAGTDPVKLNGRNISSLLYADDMLLLSYSEAGMQKTLNILDEYCHRWQLVVNTDKTKIMIFNKNKFTCEFKYQGKNLDIVHEYTYLGLKISKSGSFKPAILELSRKAQKAYFHIKSMFRKVKASPKLYLKLFDSLVKPILLYGADVWGGFGHRRIYNNDILLKCLDGIQTSYERLNLNLCKQSLGMPKRCSNIAARAELGRFPLAKDILASVIKYDQRLKYMSEDELLNTAYKSQNSLLRNSGNTFTFVDVVNKLKCQLQITSDNEVLGNLTSTQIKGKLVNLGRKVSKACANYYIENIFSPFSILKRENVLDKLHIYVMVKNNFRYESYLDNINKYTTTLTRFRLSCHWLPIERGRYKKPIIPREQRFCTFCQNCVGNEFHGLLMCTGTNLENLRKVFLPKIISICPQIQKLSTHDIFLYLIKCHDKSVTTVFAEWVDKCNNLYKEQGN